MAKEIQQVVTDDLDGSPDAATIRFALDGREYQIDLAPRNEATMRDVLEPYVAAAAEVRPIRGGGRRASTGSGRDRNQAIRAWTLGSGVRLPDRGRIAGGVIEAYDAQDVDALYQAVGLEREPTKPSRRRKAVAAQFSSHE